MNNFTTAFIFWSVLMGIKAEIRVAKLRSNACVASVNAVYCDPSFAGFKRSDKFELALHEACHFRLYHNIGLGEPHGMEHSDCMNHYRRLAK